MSYLERPVEEGEFVEWVDLTGKWRFGGSSSAQEIKEAMRILDLQEAAGS